MGLACLRHALGGTHFCPHPRVRNSFPLVSPWGQNLPSNRALGPRGLAHSLRQIFLEVSRPYAHVVRAGLFNVLPPSLRGGPVFLEASRLYAHAGWTGLFNDLPPSLRGGPVFLEVSRLYTHAGWTGLFNDLQPLRGLSPGSCRRVRSRPGRPARSWKRGSGWPGRAGSRSWAGGTFWS